ncbi:MAG: radical SAM protein [Lachnospiraceae bacterium]|nr:radical SAM protein [Lachnospiraceae bacterium]
MTIQNVDWQITCQCNRKCRYCFGPSGIKMLPMEKIYKVIDILMAHGMRQLGITGGEPLMHPYIFDIINYADNLGLKIYLSTNCDFYLQYSDLIKNKVSIIGIPVDGFNAKTHDYHRGNKSFQNIINAMNDICNSNNRIKMKIGTVVTKYNCDQLPVIEKLISQYSSKIVFWKLYEMITYDRNADNVKKMSCEQLNFNINLGNYLSKDKIIINTIKDRTNGYFFLKPNADVFIPILDNGISSEIVIGNILENNIEQAISRFKKLVNLQNYYKNCRYIKID